MSGSKKLLAASAVIAYAITAFVRPAHAPEFDLRNPGFVSNHELVPTPIMGIRGEIRMLPLPTAA